MTEDPRIDPADLRNVRFPGSSRRYDARSVDQFLETVAARIAATNDLVDQLHARIADLDAAGPVAAPAPPPPQLAHLDDDELVRLVGEETASVLSTARRAADEIRSKAEEAAARMIREATTEADRVTAGAKATSDDLTQQAEAIMERATADAAVEAARIRDEAAAEAAETTASATQLAEAELAAAEARRSETDAEVERILGDAREEGRGMVQEAKEVRTRVLEDMQRRRDAARDQIERLLAGRERLLAAYGLVRENLDDITSQLADSLPDPGPELPDGFVGIVASTAPAAGGDAAGEGDDAEVAPDGEGALDDTVAPRTISETEADIAANAVEPDTSPPDVEAVVVDDDAATEAPDDGSGDAEVDDAPADDADEVDEIDETAADDPEGPSDQDPPASGPDAPDGLSGEQDEAAEDSLTADLADPALADDGSVGSTDPEGVPVEGPGAEADVAGDEADVDERDVDDGSPTAEPAVEPDRASPDDDVPTELDADQAEGHAPGAGGDVDELFARLRAERAQSVAQARAVVGADPDAESPSPEAVPEADVDAEVGQVAEAERGTTPDARNDVDRVPAEFLADEVALAARADALAPLDAALTRALKRRLADEQNELLDLLRRSGATTAAELLPDLATQVEGYARVVEEHLLGAAIAGGEVVGALDDVDVSGLAEGVGAALVEPFRRRVERSASEVDDPDELDERLRALYREWKVQHIGPVAEDALLSAYALGTMRAAEPDRRVRWSIDPGQGPCPDAQDNALAGAVAAGEAFATGDACPQAHPGCRCLLVVD